MYTYVNMFRVFVRAVERRLMKARSRAWVMVIILYGRGRRNVTDAVSNEPSALSDILFDSKAVAGTCSNDRRLRSEHGLPRVYMFEHFLGVLFEVTTEGHRVSRHG